MQSQARTPEDYINELPADRKEVFSKLRSLILANLPSGFKEVMDGMLGYVVPHSLYPAGYHCNPKSPLPFLGLASQKHFIALYHMGIYADPELMNWFTAKYAELCKTKLDMGKSCIRFKKTTQIPYELIAELVTKMSVQQWIDLYEKKLKR